MFYRTHDTFKIWKIQLGKEFIFQYLQLYDKLQEFGNVK